MMLSRLVESMLVKSQRQIWRVQAAGLRQSRSPRFSSCSQVLTRPHQLQRGCGFQPGVGGGVPTSLAASATHVSASTRAAVQSYVTRMTRRFREKASSGGCQERASKTFKKLTLDETSSEATIVMEGCGPGRGLRKAIRRYNAMCMQHRCA